MRGKNAFVVLLSSLGSALFAGTPVEIVNAGFEQTGADGAAIGWSAHPNWRVVRGAGHNGSNGIAFECADGSARRPGRPQQRISLKPGKRYRISALAKAEDIRTDRPSTYMGLTILVSGYDAQGKWVFDDIARPCARGTGGDWVKLEGVTRKVPDNVAYALVQPHAPQALGRGVMDNFLVCEAEEAPVVGVYSSAYRNEAAEGKVAFHAALNLDSDRKPSDYSAAFLYEDARGKASSAPGRIVSSGEAAVELDVKGLALGTHEVVCAVSLGGKEIGRAAVPFVRVRKATPRKVGVDRIHRTIVDGKPFFPLGMYFHEVTPSNLDIYAQAPFNTVLSYRQLDSAALDLCHARGYKVIYNLQGGMNDPDAGKVWVSGRVAALKDHPALLAWYTNDERPISEIPKLAQRQRWIEALDPDHPTWSVQDVAAEVRGYMPTCDILGLDPYPVSEWPVGKVIRTIRQGRAGTFGIRPVWAVPQAFGWNWLHRTTGQDQLAPTRAQLANMTWQAIAGGANGLVCYSFYAVHEPHSTCNNADEFTWKDLCGVVREVKKCEEILLADGIPVEVSGAPEALGVRAWSHRGADYLLVVNGTEARLAASLKLSRRFTRVSAAFGPAPSLAGDVLDVDFPPLAYSMLRLK